MGWNYHADYESHEGFRGGHSHASETWASERRRAAEANQRQKGSTKRHSKAIERQIEAAFLLLEGWQVEMASLRRIMKARQASYEEIQQKLLGYTERCLQEAQKHRLPIELIGGKLCLVTENLEESAATVRPQMKVGISRETDMTQEEVMDFIDYLEHQQ